MATSNYVYDSQQGCFQQIDKPPFYPDDPAVAYGRGAFTTVLVQDGRAVHLDQHLQRLQEHTKAVDITLPNIMPSHVGPVLPPSGCYRMKLLAATQGVFLLIKPYTPPLRPYQVCLYPHPIDTPLSKIKSLAYLDRVLAKEYAEKRGYDEALVCDRRGILLEAAYANIFWKMDGEIFTPDPQLPLLFGITLRQVLKKAAQEGVKTHFVQVRPKEIPQHAQLFLTNSLINIWSAKALPSL